MTSAALIGPALIDVDGRRKDRARSRRVAFVYGVLFLVLALLIVASLLVGQGHLSDAGLRSTLLGIRASRLGAAFLAGAALGVAGLLTQGLFRNPLADASVLGTSAGATLGGNGAVLALELLTKSHAIRGVPPDAVLPIGCLAGALVALSVLLRAPPPHGRRAVGDPDRLPPLFALSEPREPGDEPGPGSMGARAGDRVVHDGWNQQHRRVSPRARGAARRRRARRGVVLGQAARRSLSGDEEAGLARGEREPGAALQVLWTAVLTAGAVSLGGNLMFVGLLVPHALRPLLGVEHRRLVPASALAGAVFVAACDLLVRLIPARSEIPLGVFTGLLGAPAFLVLLARNQKEAQGALTRSTPSSGSGLSVVRDKTRGRRPGGLHRAGEGASSG